MTILKNLAAELSSATAAALTLSSQIDALRQQVEDLSRLTATAEAAPSIEPDPEPVTSEPFRLTRRSGGTRYRVDPDAPERTCLSGDGTWGTAANAWWWAEFPDCIRSQFKPAIALRGYLQRVVKYNRSFYDVTPLGDEYFFVRPYASSPSFPELFITKAGQQMVRDLYRAGKLPRRGNRGADI